MRHNNHLISLWHEKVNLKQQIYNIFANLSLMHIMPPPWMGSYRVNITIYTRKGLYLVGYILFLEELLAAHRDRLIAHHLMPLVWQPGMDINSWRNNCLKHNDNNQENLQESHNHR